MTNKKSAAMTSTMVCWCKFNRRFMVSTLCGSLDDYAASPVAGGPSLRLGRYHALVVFSTVTPVPCPKLDGSVRFACAGRASGDVQPSPGKWRRGHRRRRARHARQLPEHLPRNLLHISAVLPQRERLQEVPRSVAGKR